MVRAGSVRAGVLWFAAAALLVGCSDGGGVGGSGGADASGSDLTSSAPDATSQVADVLASPPDALEGGSPDVAVEDTPAPDVESADTSVGPATDALSLDVASGPDADPDSSMRLDVVADAGPKACEPRDPGAVTIQRLNRDEYDRTLADLLGDQSGPSSTFPPDDSVLGYDNIASALSVSPLLFEKHERVVTGLVEEALTVEVPTPEVHHFEAELLGGSAGGVAGAGWNLWSNGTVSAEVELAAGTWLLSARVFGQQAGPALAEMNLALGDTVVPVQVAADAAGPGVYAITAPLTAGPHVASVTFTNDYWDPDAGEDRNLVVDWLRLEGPFPDVMQALHLEPEAGEPLDGFAHLAAGEALAVPGVTAAGTWRVVGRVFNQLGAPTDIALEAGGEALEVIPLEDLGSAVMFTATLTAEAALDDLSLVADAGPLDVDFVRVEGPLDLPVPPKPAGWDEIMVCEPTPGAEAECAREVVGVLARRAWRRPVTEAEVDGAMALYDLAVTEGAAPIIGIQLAVEAVLLSPHFLFRPQVDPDLDAVEPRPLTDHELAARLAYALWSTMPDDELSSVADMGLLQDDVVLEEQTLRMLDDPRSVALVDNFAGQWLQLRRLDDVFRDAEAFPDFDDELAAAMRTETELLFEELLTSDMSFLDLVDAEFTWVDERLGEFYGLPVSPGQAFEKVSTAGTQRRGILGHASVLTVTSHTFRTSPVQRGKWVLGQLLCRQPPAPPPGVDALVEPAEGDPPKSLKERMAQHLADPTCAVCHAEMDPIGFALENFDAIGAWRDDYDGLAIDATSEMPDGTQLDGLDSLVAVIKQDPDTALCMSTHVFRYLMGRGDAEGDACELAEIRADWEAGGYRLRDLISRMVMSEAFRLRQPPGGPDAEDDESGQGGGP